MAARGRAAILGHVVWQALREDPEKGRPETGAAAPDSLEGLDRPQAEPGYFCALCGELITYARERTCVQGAHEHRFSNPAGYVFDIGCFRNAPGCRSAGESSEFYSWFDGFSWRYTLCRACGAHLGWHFTASGPGGVSPEAGGFFGLILNRLTGRPEAPPAR